MNGSTGGRLRPTLYGAVAGGLLGLCLLVAFTGKFALGSVDAVLLDANGARARSEFVISSGGLYLVTVIAGVLGALAVASIVYAVGKESDPLAPRFSLGTMLPVAGLAGAIFSYGILRAGLGATADIELGVVTVSVFRLTVIVLLSGIVAGGITANVVDALARPATLGIAGEAVPQSLGAFATEMARAIGSPMISVIVLAIVAIGLSQILLAVEGTTAVIVFAVAGAVVLGGAALAAYQPWQRSGG